MFRGFFSGFLQRKLFTETGAAQFSAAFTGRDVTAESAAAADRLKLGRSLMWWEGRVVVVA